MMVCETVSRLFQHVNHPTTRGGPKHVIFEIYVYIIIIYIYIYVSLYLYIYIFHTILGTKTLLVDIIGVILLHILGESFSPIHGITLEGSPTESHQEALRKSRESRCRRLGMSGGNPPEKYCSLLQNDRIRMTPT